MGRRPARRWLALAAVLLLACGCSTFRDPRGAQCGFMDQPVIAQVAMAHARDYQLHFPRMGLSPELDLDAPAFAVAFAGPINLPTTGGPGLGAQGPANGVVCVVLNGAATYYTDVDITGWR